MNVKLTFFFEGTQAAVLGASSAVGWTENFYGTNDSLGTLDSWLVSPDVNNFMEKRRACLDRLYRISFVRASDELNPRSFKVRAIDSGYGTANLMTVDYLGATLDLHSQVQCALLVDLVKLPSGAIPGDHTHHRKYLMRGLPTDVIDGNVLRTVTGNWQRIRNFLAWLASHSTGEVIPAGAPRTIGIGLRFVNVALSVWGPLSITTNVGTMPRYIQTRETIAGTPNLDKVQIANVPGTAGPINRIWTLIQNTAADPPVTVLGTSRRALPTVSYTPPGPGRRRLLHFAYGLFDQYTIIGLRSKKTGRVFHQLRGRSSTRGTA